MISTGEVTNHLCTLFVCFPLLNFQAFPPLADFDNSYSYSSPPKKNKPSQLERIVFQPMIFRGEVMLFLRGGYTPPMFNHQTFRWYLKWRNAYLQKLYGYGLCKGKSTLQNSLKVQNPSIFRYLKILG